MSTSNTPKSLSEQRLGNLVELMTDAKVPKAVKDAVENLAEAFDADNTGPPWWKAWTYKDGKFSKTAMWVGIANVITLGWFALSIFAGAELDLGFTKLVIQRLDPGLALGVAGALNAAYIANNSIKSKTPH